MSEVIGKEACPSCRKGGGDNSGDNLIRYQGGSAYCFACEYSERAEGSTPTTAQPKSPKKMNGMLSDIDYVKLGKRKISLATCEKFNYGIAVNSKGKKFQVASYYDEGTLVAQKLRDKDKKFAWLGDAADVGFFGQHLWGSSPKVRVVITEGEIDALSISTMQEDKWPVVSVPNGAAAAYKTVAAELEWLAGFKEVVFAFDMDEPGQEAARKCAELLPPGNARIATLPEKDANACLVSGKTSELRQALWTAPIYRPDGIVSAGDIFEEASQPLAFGLPWPWDGLSLTYGRRRGELYGFGGGTGCGKSTVFKQIAKHIVEQDNLPIGGIFLEERPTHTLRTMAGMFLGKRLHVPGVEFDQGEVRSFMESLSDKVYLYDHFGTSSWETLKNKIRYMVHALGIKDIFLDHLTALAASIEGEDERRSIDVIMAELSGLTQELDCTIYYISHLATPHGKSHEEGGRVLEKHFRGSRAIAYWSHFLFGIERDKQDRQGVTTFRVLKDRYTGDSNGVTFGLEYDTNTGLLNQCELPVEDSPFKSDGEY